VLGSFTATAHGDTVPLGVDARRAVAYLAVHRRPQHRVDLAADLWPGVPAAAALQLLDEALTGPREAGLLAEHPEGAAGPVALDAAVEIDLDEAMALVRTLAQTPGRADGVPADLPAATALLRADILPGEPAAWLAVERERFRQIRLNALEELSASLSTAGRHAEAVARYDEYQELLRSSVGAATGSGLDGLLPPVPAWPVLRVNRSMQRIGMTPPGMRIARTGSRRLVSGGSVPGATR